MRDRLPEQEANIALLIDADNASPDHLDEVLLVLGELVTINIRRAYGNWAKASLKGWGNLTGQQSIVPVQQFDVVKGKSVTDMRMVIDAMDLMYRGHVEGFGIMSSDSDFLPLAIRIREEGLPVYGFGTAKTRNQFVLDWIAADHENDWNRLGCCLGRQCGIHRPASHDNRDALVNELGYYAG